jgi:hypothetical protein
VCPFTVVVRLVTDDAMAVSWLARVLASFDMAEMLPLTVDVRLLIWFVSELSALTRAFVSVVTEAEIVEKRLSEISTQEPPFQT